MNILDYIPEGKENAVTRAELVAATGLPDRAVRRCIAAARRDDALILNDQDGEGYYIVSPRELDLLARQYRQDRARALSILARCKSARRILKDAGRIEKETARGGAASRDAGGKPPRKNT